MQLLLDEGYSIAEAVELEKQAQAAEKFAHFWKAAEAVRHGETSWISPLCVSLKDLMSKCEAKMEALFPESDENFVPSYEYFRIQFTPRNSRSHVAKRYYGRFDVKFGLQKRTLHKSHVDQHYGAKQFQYLKQMAGMQAFFNLFLEL